MPGLWLRKLACKTWKTVARVTAAPTPAALSPRGCALSADTSRREVSRHSPLAFTDEGTECQRVRGVSLGTESRIS